MMIRFFDKAAIVMEGDVLPSGEPKLWRLFYGASPVFYDRVLVRVLRRFTGRPNGITHL
jgi:hypothetical protein